MKGTTILSVGSRILYEGAQWSLALFEGTEAVLERSDPKAFLRARIVSLLDRNGPFTLLFDGSETPAVLPADTALLMVPPPQLDAVLVRVAHIREVLTGYQSGNKEQPLEGEPRAEYAPSVSLMKKYQAKADELGVSMVAVRQWVRTFKQEGVLGLVDGRLDKAATEFHGCSSDWLKIAREVIDEQTERSNKTTKNLLRIINTRVKGTHGDTARIPGRTSAYRAINSLTTGRAPHNARRRRSLARGPSRGFGGFRASRPGQVVLMDTNRLDVYAMDHLTLRWVQVELTAAMDLYSRCILALVLTPVSTKSADVAAVLYEILRPREAPPDWPEDVTWPYHGVPERVLVLQDSQEVRFCGPGILPDTATFDHGKVFISAHVTNACEELGISLQPARKYTPYDKAPLERFFLTLRTGLLELLPGYTGEDLNARGEGIEDQATYTVAQLEDILREWVAFVYHRTALDDAVESSLPGLKLSPLQRYAHGIAAAGAIVLPRSADLAMHLLDVEPRKINPEGVHIRGLVYKGPVLGTYINRQTPYPNLPAMEWPFRVNKADLSEIYFQDPEDLTWHVLTWEGASSVGRPFNSDALEIAKRLAEEKKIEVEAALRQLLDRWDAGLTLDAKERKAALRLAHANMELNRGVEALAAKARAAERQDPQEEFRKRLQDQEAETPAAGVSRKPATPGDYYADAVRLI